MIELRDERADRGETLIELIVSVVILGVVAVAVSLSLGTAIKVTKTHRDESVAGTTLRSYAEYLETTVAAGGYVTNASVGTATYQYGSAPSGYKATLTAVRCWAPNTKTWVGCGTDKGIQRLVLTVTSKDGLASETLTVMLREPCTVGSAATCS